jgi:hypothetical protein
MDEQVVTPNTWKPSGVYNPAGLSLDIHVRRMTWDDVLITHDWQKGGQ